MLYGYRYRKTATPAVAQPPAPWHTHLPPPWRSQVRAPQSFEVFREPELAAERCFGYDAQRIACYYAHTYRIDELRSDDDEEFYLCTLYGETLTAWLLDDGRWLIHRLVRTDEHGEGQAFYSFSQSMPR